MQILRLDSPESYYPYNGACVGCISVGFIEGPLEEVWAWDGPWCFFPSNIFDGHVLHNPTLRIFTKVLNYLYFLSTENYYRKLIATKEET
jgi:hypothetical protein